LSSSCGTKLGHAEHLFMVEAVSDCLIMLTLK
jgi:hypothetical protein